MKPALFFIEAILLACVASGCGARQPGFPSADAMNAKSIQRIRPLAAYAMHCDGAALAFTPLSTDAEHAGYVTQYGVDGCGTRIVYVHLDGSDWVANTTSEEHSH